MKNLFIGLIAITLLAGCSSSSSKTYTGVGQGKNGEIKVEVVMNGEKIESIKVVEQSETPNYFKTVEEKLIPTIIEKQSVEVDIVSGASLSSNGVLEAVKDAVEQSKAK